MSLLGVGVLVGAALIIIIPEGIHMYLAAAKAASEGCLRFHVDVFEISINYVVITAESAEHNHVSHHGAEEHAGAKFADHDAELPLFHLLHDRNMTTLIPDHDHEDEGMWLIGASIAVGFAFMLVVDQISAGYGHAHAPAEGLPETAQHRWILSTTFNISSVTRAISATSLQLVLLQAGQPCWGSSCMQPLTAWPLVRRSSSLSRRVM